MRSLQPELHELNSKWVIIIIYLVGWGGDCVTPVLELDHLSKGSNWIGLRTGVHGFDSRTSHKTSEADIWLSSYDYLTDVGELRGGCQQLSQRKGACFLLNKKEALSEFIQVKMMKRGMLDKWGVYGCQL